MDDSDQRRREGTGSCSGSGRANCGDTADCVNTPNGHECVCHAGFERGDGTSCVQEGDDGIAEWNGSGHAADEDSYLDTWAEQQTVVCTSGNCAGMETWRLYGKLRAGAENIYAVYGNANRAAPLDLPPAFQVDPPYGVHTGGVNRNLFEVAPTSDTIRPQFDSWLTIGETEGSSSADI